MAGKLGSKGVIHGACGWTCYLTFIKKKYIIQSLTLELFIFMSKLLHCRIWMPVVQY